MLSLDQTVLISWNELIVSRFSDANALLQCLSDLLNDCSAQIDDVQIHVGCFCQNRAASIVKRVELVVTQAFANIQQNRESRYLLQIEQQLHVLEWRAGRADYMSFADAAELLEYLSHEQAQYLRWRVAEYALQGHVLKFILPLGRVDAVQVIYEEDGTVTLYCAHQEFSEFEYGARLYHYVARYILGMLRTTQRYPCYITDIDLSKVQASNSVQTMHFLQRKTILEKCLNEALQAL